MMHAMTVLGHYHERHFGELGETSHVINGSVYDPALASPAPGVEMVDGLKKLIWRDGVPYGRHKRTGEEIRFNSLHCQGHAKRLMSEYCTAYSRTISS
jgi:hypothetical protein